MIAELQRRIEQYLAGGRSRTLHSLAGRSGVSYSTLRRIAQSECKAVELPSAIGILQATATWADTLDFLERHFPGTGKHLQKLTGPATDNASDELERALLGFEKFVAISMAATPMGTTEKDVVDAVGIHAAAQIEELLGAGVLVLRNGRLFTAQANFASLDVDRTAAQVGHCLRLLRAEHMGQQMQIAALHSNGVSREGQKEIHETLATALARVDDIAARNPGALPVFYGLVMGTFAAGRGCKHA